MGAPSVSNGFEASRNFQDSVSTLAIETTLLCHSVCLCREECKRVKRLRVLRCTNINIATLIIFLFQANALMWPEQLGGVGEGALPGGSVLSSAFKALHTLGSIFLDLLSCLSFCACFPWVLNDLSRRTSCVRPRAGPSTLCVP